MLRAEIEVEVDHRLEASTAELWRPEHSSPSKPTLIFGDEAKFLADCEAARRRARRRIQHAGTAKTLYPPERWQEWWFDEEIWNVAPGS